MAISEPAVGGRTVVNPDARLGSKGLALGTGARRRRDALRPRARKEQLIRRATQVGILVVWLGAWEVVAKLKLINPALASTPQQTWDAWFGAAKSGVLWTNFEATLEATLVAFVLASVAGIVIGLMLGLLPKLSVTLEPYFNALNSMPRIALAPLFVLYFGIGSTAKVALAFSLVVFILIVNSRAGVLSIDSDVIRLSTVMGSNRKQIFFKVFLPGSVPAIFAGLRLGLVYSLLGVVTMELVAARNGLGVLVGEYGNTFNMSAVYAILITLAIVGAILNQIMAVVERRVSRWQATGDATSTVKLA